MPVIFKEIPAPPGAPTLGSRSGAPFVPEAVNPPPPPATLLLSPPLDQLTIEAPLLLMI